MLSIFREINKFDEIEKHLIDNKVVFTFTGSCFLVLSYNAKRKIGIIKSYNLLDQIYEQVDECNLIELIDWIKQSMKSYNYHYMLYDGDLNIDDRIYDFIREFFNPIEEMQRVGYN